MTTASQTQDTSARFAVFRAHDAKTLTDQPIVRWTPPGAISQQGWQQLVEAGYHEGHETRVVFCTPGFSLTWVWFKSALPLPRHTHDTDCLYYLLAGSLRIGQQTLTAGDGFFVGKDVPYSYVPGDQGVEVLEFRASHNFDIRLLAENPGFWQQATATAQQRRATWATEPRPDKPSPQP